jgi:UDP-N-acetylglucosamine 2-epimerase (non-hydrolysing)
MSLYRQVTGVFPYINQGTAVIPYSKRWLLVIHIIIGTKAQLIKVAPIMVALQERNIDYNFIFTGQHRETIDKLQENFDLRCPDVVLYQGRDITGIIQMLFWMLFILSKSFLRANTIFKKQGESDIVLVHGDTFSTVLGALMGKVAGKKIAHIESGLRSYDLLHPFPEEINRLMTFYLADVYFCPGQWAMQNLRRFTGQKINTFTNTLHDALTIAKQRLADISVDIPEQQYALVSLHRFENIFNKARFQQILLYLKQIASQIKILFILHPPTLKQLEEYKFYDDLKCSKNIEMRPRYDYFQFIKLLRNCRFLITDGGSNQEEAFYLGKPTLLFRNTTERNEGIGENVVVSKYDLNIIERFVANYHMHAHPEPIITFSASEIIVESLIEYY